MLSKINVLKSFFYFVTVELDDVFLNESKLYYKNSTKKCGYKIIWWIYFKYTIKIFLVRVEKKSVLFICFEYIYEYI